MIRVLVLMAVLSLGVQAAAKRPKTVVHVVTVKWKEGTTPEQINAALRGAEKAADTYKGIVRVWTRAIKVQGAGYTHAIVMEFKDELALKNYTDSPAQKEWYKVYIPIREQSTTHDISN
jgi:uncharacterized protein (DUF1330 family)